MTRWTTALLLVLCACDGNDPSKEDNPAPEEATRRDSSPSRSPIATPQPGYVRLLDLLGHAEYRTAYRDELVEWVESPVVRLSSEWTAESVEESEGWTWREGEGGSERLEGAPGSDPLRLRLLVQPGGRYRVRGRVRRSDRSTSPLAVSSRIPRFKAGVSPDEISFEETEVDPIVVEGPSFVPEPGGWERVELGFSIDRAVPNASLWLEAPTEGEPVQWQRLELVRCEPTDRSVLSRVADEYPVDDLEVPVAFRKLVKRVSAVVADGARHEDRHAIHLPAPSEISWPLTVAWPASLRFALGFLPSAHTRSNDGARFEVDFVDQIGECTRLFERHLETSRDPRRQSWTPVRVDLSDLVGKTGRLIFRTGGSEDPLGPQDYEADFAVVANPALFPAERPEARKPNVVLIGVDTLRADHLSAYGYERPTSPRLEELAREGIRFARALAPAPWTLPSFTSALTSLYPSRHGAGRGGRGGWTRVHPDAVFLSERLYDAGYLTAGQVANHLISPKYGLEQGYEIYAHPYRGGFESVQVEVPRLEAFIAENKEAPFFLFWHIMDTHLPYDVPERFREKFLDPEYEGRFEDGVSFNYLVRRPGRRCYAHEGHPEIPSELTDADKKRIVDYYDAEVAEVDEAIGQVLDALKREGLWDDTIVAVIADHGEGLADHDHYHHGYTLYEDQIRVPLILRIPGGPSGKVVDTPVSTIDVMPMVLASLGLKAPEDVQGVDRLDPANADVPVFSEYATYDSSALKAVYAFGRKYLEDPVFEKQQLLAPALDSSETEDRLESEAELAAKARKLLNDFRQQSLYAGRYHLRIRGPEGSVAKGTLRASDVFDANAAWLSREPSAGLRFDLERSRLDFETQLSGGRAELIFWFRGDGLRLELSIGGEPVPTDHIQLGEKGGPLGEGGSVAASEIPNRQAKELSWPSEGAAMLWYESSGLRSLPTVDTPEDLERLRALGYVR
ncbi:MAG: sulfatase-like hydrolase/transferase [Planctomycetota bacterium]